jgi:molybdopterin biosynthesis enzyme MoaB
VIRVELPGFGEVMRAGSLKLSPNAIFSRSLVAIVDHSLVISPYGVNRKATWIALASLQTPFHIR